MPFILRVSLISSFVTSYCNIWTVPPRPPVDQDHGFQFVLQDFCGSITLTNDSLQFFFLLNIQEVYLQDHMALLNCQWHNVSPFVFVVPKLQIQSGNHYFLYFAAMVFVYTIAVLVLRPWRQASIISSYVVTIIIKNINLAKIILFIIYI